MSKPLVSVVIPARNERFLNPTIRDLLKKAKGPIEILVHLDGYWPDEVVQDERVKYIHSGKVCGMRAGINKCVAIAQGDYILKSDGHVLWDEGFDVKLAKDMQPNWVVIPRRKRLDAEKWEEEKTSKPDIDYERLSYPSDEADWGGAGLNGRIWTERIRDNKEIKVDKNMSFQGSAWFMTKEFFHKCKLMDDKSFGEFWNEAQEISFRTVLCQDGTVMVNKNTFYCHLHKGKKWGRGYRLEESQLKAGRNMAMKFFAGEKVWEEQKYPLSYLIEQFMPLPEWDEEKLNKLKEREKQHGWK